MPVTQSHTSSSKTNLISQVQHLQLHQNSLQSSHENFSTKSNNYNQRNLGMSSSTGGQLIGVVPKNSQSHTPMSGNLTHQKSP